MESNQKPTILLVQGAWHDAEVWLPLRGELFRRGYRTVTTPLPSSGTAPSGSMLDDSAVLERVLLEIAGPTVVVAHSYGGIPATDAAARVATVQRLIYLAAYVPDEDGSMFSLHGIPDPESTEGLFPAIGSPRTSLYRDLPDDQAEFAQSLLVEQTTRSFVDRVVGAGWKTIPTSYIVTDEDEAIPPAMQLAMAEHAGAELHHLASSHSPFLSKPAELADLVHRLITRNGVAE